VTGGGDFASRHADPSPFALSPTGLKIVQMQRCVAKEFPCVVLRKSFLA
jgi:hypothetical protein